MSARTTQSASDAWPIGSTAYLPVQLGGHSVFTIAVIVLDHRTAFGRLDVQVRPLDERSGGSGWTSADRLISVTAKLQTKN